MLFLQILVLGLVQGAAELLPVSSSAHVIVAEKLMGLDPSSPTMTFLLVMLHTGTMLAVIVFFAKAWRAHYFSSKHAFKTAASQAAVATVATGVVYGVISLLIKKVFLHGTDKAEVESLFSQLSIVGVALFLVGLLIIGSGMVSGVRRPRQELNLLSSTLIGAVQGLCLPFRGFSRSGATISTGLLLGIQQQRLEEFSFALAVILTPLAIGKELLRLLHSQAAQAPVPFLSLITPGLFGMVCSFASGLLALALLSNFLSAGKWKYFGYYCLVAAMVVLGLWRAGF